MNQSFKERLRKLSSFDSECFKGIKRGLEKEALRVDPNGKLSSTPHPLALGSSLCHPMITTDYSEALLEFITEPTTDLEVPRQQLTDIHRFTQAILGQERLWPGSMPCALLEENEVPIANYGSSYVGQIKHIYRKGLGYRYGRLMQTISGTHYNFSLPAVFWEHYHDLVGSTLSLQAFISEQYLGIIRNAERFGWLITYLFGASPVILRSMLKSDYSGLEPSGDQLLIGAHATSLRLGDSGYSNTIQSRINISHNNFEEFISTVRKAVHTPAPEYAQANDVQNGEYLQLSDAILQIEDEHYAQFRPKRVSGSEERLLMALARDGIEYIEVRALDVDPFSPIGILEDTAPFLDTFLLTCLLMDSPVIDKAEKARIDYNHSQVVIAGRKPGLRLKGPAQELTQLKELALEFIELMQGGGEILDRSYSKTMFATACDRAQNQVSGLQSLPSERILTEMKENQESYFELMLRLSTEHKRYFDSEQLVAEKKLGFEQLAQKTLLEQKQLELKQKGSFTEYLQKHLEF